MGSLSVYDFGRELLRTNDLDPVYVLLWEAGLARPVLQRWLLSYWCFYHVGTASWTSEGDYWSRMRTAAGSKDWPRCHERRHFRGANAAKSVTYLSQRGVTGLFDDLAAAGTTVAAKMAAVQEWVGFGPWIAFKVADMLERLAIAPVRFDTGAMLLFDSPRRGAECLWVNEMGDEAVPTNVGQWAVDRILQELGPLKAPPRYERPINVQEAETILCKWKSYMGGHYHVGEDVAACKRGLLRFAKTRLAQCLLAGGKKGGLW